MKPTILFADNERSIRQFCKLELEADGYRVLVAMDGDEAIEIARTFAVDLVVLDEHMPACSGLEAARRIKMHFPRVPVILFTADWHFEQYRSPAIDETVVKTADLNRLRQAIFALLSSGTETSGDPKRSDRPLGVTSDLTSVAKNGPSTESIQCQC